MSDQSHSTGQRELQRRKQTARLLLVSIGTADRSRHARLRVPCSSLLPPGMAGCIATPWLLSPLQRRPPPTAPSQLPTQTLAPNISHDDTGEREQQRWRRQPSHEQQSATEAVQLLLRVSNVTVVVAAGPRWRRPKFAAAATVPTAPFVRWPCSCHCSVAQRSMAVQMHG